MFKVIINFPRVKGEELILTYPPYSQRPAQIICYFLALIICLHLINQEAMVIV